MAETKKKSMTVLVVAAMLFVAGLILGYYFWGLNNDKQLDHKAFLQETINYIATLEHKNKKLLDTVDGLETEMNMLEQKQAAGAAQNMDQIDALSQRISLLEKENRLMAVAVSENKELVRENLELKQKLRAIMDKDGAEQPDSSSLEPPVKDTGAELPSEQ
ncbi:MAG TPA: hypothetical protein ENN05_11475 [Deltaproteobacteria bacterium]|nr:hypothetical protein [Deltaproteobacteria bacterium]